MKKATLIANLLLGIGFLVFGLNFWLKVLPTPPPPTEAAGQFLGILYMSGFLAVVKALEVLGGLAVLSQRFAPFGLLILGPILVVINLYDLFIAKSFNPPSAILSLLALFLLYSYRHRFAAFLGMRKQAGPSKV